jgi:HSP20 family protein
VLPTKQKFSSTVQVRDLDDHSEISIAAPGLSKEDFDVSLKNEHLTVSYEKSIDDNPRLFSKQAFSRSWSVPRRTKMKDISAKYDAGILTVSVKKSEKAEPKAYSIKIA